MTIVQELSLARTAEAVQKVVRTAARELMDAEGATFVLRAGDECHYVDEDAIAPLWKGEKFPLATCVSGWVMEHGEPAIIPDIHADERVPADVYRTTFVQSLVMVPIRASQPIGAIGAYWASKHRAGPEQVELLRALGDSTSIALENVWLYAKLAQEVDQHARAAEAAQRELAERRRAEEALTRTEQQLRQAQKMDAIGRFAGGIAHDFNNMLSVILSYGSLALRDVAEDDSLRDFLEEIQRAGQRAAELTHQLLAFSRRQPFERRRVDLNRVVTAVQNMLRPMLGDGIQLEVRQAPRIAPVLSDEGQLQQVLVNVALNARDAMPDGGKLVVETREVVLDDAYARQNVGARPGPHVLLEVTDTGHGMDGETQLRVFEPFFTTKPKGAGTGLGLSTAYGIVKQSGGHIEVASAPDQGTTIRVFLPRVETTQRFRDSAARSGFSS